MRIWMSSWPIYRSGRSVTRARSASPAAAAMSTGPCSTPSWNGWRPPFAVSSSAIPGKRRRTGGRSSRPASSPGSTAWCRLQLRRAQGSTGGSIIDGPGNFFAPTILTDVQNSSAIVQEEIFGPVHVVLPFDEEEEAIRMANDSDFGLHGAVFPRDLERGFALAGRIRSGTLADRKSVGTGKGESVRVD